ncbi:MAG: 16S rRNA (uracil(1498)-N(3))-methyltransferase [Desulfuromonadaceae bacterium]|nr:16S rRNA (uracil(1498)-N(3))-methyltransferase [Desulfuromonas sp.]MDY0185400.1 16S rRNA (uracil(1498)-N(3))-methyltransferase [Desulfuromonadaceae bacterium]
MHQVPSHNLMRRFYVPCLEATAQTVELSAEISHHIVTVLRLRPTDVFDLCDGAGHCWRVELEVDNAKKARVRVLEQRTEAETAVYIELLQGVPKGERFDLVLQKNTELGVSRFIPVYTQRCQGRIAREKEEKKRQRWEKIVQEAARQSGRSWMPKVENPTPLEAALQACTAGLRLVLWEEAETALNAVLPAKLEHDGEQVEGRERSTIAVLIGPEGGLAPDDLAQARSYGFVPVRFGPRILRTETAGFAVNSVLQYLYGDTGASPQQEDEPR